MASGQILPPPASTDYDSQVSPLNASLYEVDEEFLSAQTGIKDREELKQHVLKVQADAYAVYPYPCIKTFEIAKSKINRYSAYSDLLKLGKERSGAIFLDVGCCVGNDVRRAIQDGFPADQALGTDLYAGFWDVGHQLFKSTPETFPVKFLPGNIFDSAFFEPQEIPANKLDEPYPTLASLTNLTPLNGRVSAIHSSLFFHLFDEEHQLKLAKLFASLLSAEPGSMIFGSHSALPEKGLVMEKIEVGKNHKTRMFCHSPESWKELWEGVLGKDKVEVKATLVQMRRKDWELQGDDTKFWLMVWSVKRV